MVDRSLRWFLIAPITGINPSVISLSSFPIFSMACVLFPTLSAWGQCVGLD